VQHLAAVLGIDRREIVDAEWADNGPGWVAVLLGSADAVLALRPGRATAPYVASQGTVLRREGYERMMYRSRCGARLP
jgi:predicted PhzF superfamily epimerase YddE/YHI9